MKIKTGQIWIEEVKNQFESAVEWHQCSYSAISECLHIYQDALIILDLSEDFQMQFNLSLLCKENKKIHLVHQKRYQSYDDEWTYGIVPSKLAQLNAYIAVLDYFNWADGLLVTDENNINAKQKFLDYSLDFDYLTVESSTNIKILVSRFIKPLGATIYYILTNSVLSLKIQEELKIKKLLLKGDGIILNQNSGYGCSIDGTIIITLEGQEYTNSQEDFLFNSIANFLNFLLSKKAEPSIAEELHCLLKEYNEKNQFSILNIKNSKREIVGSVNNGIVSIFKNVTFIGNTQVVPKSDKKNLPVTISGGTYSPGSTIKFDSNLFNGAYVAWKLINDGTLGILKNFQIKHFIFDCGQNTYDDKFTTACFNKDRDKFGLAHISSSSSLVSSEEMKLFKRLNLTIPCVGAISSDSFLKSTALYPLYTRIITSNRYILALTSLLFKALGWSKFCVLYTNAGSWSTAYLDLFESAKKYNLEILNPENSRAISEGVNKTSIKNYVNSLQTVINTQARLLVLLLGPPDIFYVIEELYDLGIRKGDFVIYVLTDNHLRWYYYDYMYPYKIKEAGVPMFDISRTVWVGKVGKIAYSNIVSMYKTVPAGTGCSIMMLLTL